MNGKRAQFAAVSVLTCVVLFSVAVATTFASGVTLTVTVVSTSTPPDPDPEPPAPPPIGSGGGGAVPVNTPTIVTSTTLSGVAYPFSLVTLLKDGQIAATTTARGDARFTMSLQDISSGDFIFSIYATDAKGRKSSAFSFPLYITQGAITQVSGIYIAPTIDVNKSQVKKGDSISIFGYTAPNATTSVNISSNTVVAKERIYKIPTTSDGSYLMIFDTDDIPSGQYGVKSKSALDSLASQYGKVVSFIVGDANIMKSVAESAQGDLNHDNRINLVDFSILAFWFGRPNPPVAADLNGDKKVDLKDFSIMAFYWTG